MNLTAYLDHIRADYLRWQNINSVTDPIQLAIRKEMAEEFCSNLSVVHGSKYIKICTGRPGRGRSVHSFIVVKPDAKFNTGDILKAASWTSPARNFARGNILKNFYSNITWTGAA
jgi:ribulose bisphosphate carboxylase small subunit